MIFGMLSPTYYIEHTIWTIPILIYFETIFRVEFSQYNIKNLSRE